MRHLVYTFLVSCLLFLPTFIPTLTQALADSSRLGRDLTPNGANPKGSADGKIPAWTGGITKPPAGNVAGVYKKRTFYADEDSWIFVGADLYDDEGKLTRFHEGFVKNYYEAPACVLDFDVMNDLESGRYDVDHLKIEYGTANLSDESISPKHFGSTALKRATGR